MELANESRSLGETAAAGGRSGMAMVRGGVGLVEVGAELGRLKAYEGKKEEEECESDLYMGTGDEMLGREEVASRGLGAEMRGRESSNFRNCRRSPKI
jgi:hypothetical protein